jgi:fructosamine-3-kinase
MSRHNIYYWKCDRPAAFHGTTPPVHTEEMATRLKAELAHQLGATAIEIRPGSGQGNHLTWLAECDGVKMFIRVEAGPEGDAHLALESAVLDAVRDAGVRTPLVHACDGSRSRVPFAWQALERFEVPDLNVWQQQGQLNGPVIAHQMGAAVASWQEIMPAGFGVLETLQKGYHGSYADFFFLRLDDHLKLLTDHAFLTNPQAQRIREVLTESSPLLDRVQQGCLVHKDLALWNVLGTADEAVAFIDFDDVISGDPMDDLSLLGCFHDASFLASAFEGYQSIRPLPDLHQERFFLHLLRNMIVKSVIRVGAGYFDRQGDFFLNNRSGGKSLRQETEERLFAALDNLQKLLQ